MNNSAIGMGISDLSRASGVPVSTIKFYNYRGLLPTPIKTGKTRAIYNSTHLNRLKLIKKLQNEEKMSLRKISDIIKLMTDKNAPEQKDDFSNHRLLIIEIATGLFRSKGYESTTIADISGAARIGKGTFYKYFNNKKDLFTACIKEVIIKESTYVDVYEGASDITNENDVLNLLNKQIDNLYWVSPLWRDMINILRAAAVNNPKEFSDTLKEVTQLKIDAFKKGIIASGIEKGVLKSFDERDLTTLAAMIVGIQEYCYDYFLAKKMDKKEGERMLEVITTAVLNGIMKK